MKKNQKKLPLLVVSASPYMRGMIKFVLETLLQTDVTELESEEKALNYLRELDEAPSMIIYDYTPNAYLLEDFVAYLKANSKKVKIMVLVDKVREDVKNILDISHFKLLEEVGLPNNLLEEVKTLFKESSYTNTEDYCRIDMNFLAILDGINKNLFIKIGEKFIKVFNEDDNTENIDIKKYRNKGIEYLYLHRDTGQWVISQIQNQIEVFLKSNNFRFILRGASDTPEKRFEQKILRINDEVHIDKEFRDSIDKSVSRIREFIEKEPALEPLFKVLKSRLDDQAFFSLKANMTSTISCVLAKQLDWISKTTMDKLIYAAVLCDITLAARPDLLRVTSVAEFERLKDEFTPEDQKIFLSHSKDGGSLVKRYFSSAPPDTDVLIMQHHELPDGSGFPFGLKAERISPLAALFIISNDFSYYVLTDEEPSIDDFILKAQSRYDFMNFRKIIKALERVKKPI
ncbi:MAG TPA: HD domain-containing phosphohydrolase, partial [Bacteriovoracaceae bacterium]|nr:HD domain-containing phosphohydrolase [Bacteriovoracaceae bacterium]